jgi:hypothetical protein
MSTTEVVVICPHCAENIIIEQLNCRIFRHATLIANNTQINPHASQEECEFYFENKLIYGCGKPFRVIECNDGTFCAVICEYV